MLDNFLREYNINRIFLSTVGLWPFQNKLVRNFLRIFFFLLEISYWLFEIMLIYNHWDNLQIVFDGSYQLVMSISFVGRIGNEFWNHDKLRRLYKAIDEHWNIFTNDVEVQVMKNYSMVSRKFTKCYSMLMFSIALIMVAVPLTPILLDIVIPLNESRLRFFAIEVDFRVSNNEYFLPIYCYTSILILVGVNVVMGVDAMHVACAAHACSLFVAINWKIKFTFVFTACLVSLMIVCYSGQRLMDESQSIFYRAYAAEWYKFSPRLKSLLIITLYRTNVPCSLNAGNMVPLSIATYVTVLRIATSYFTTFISFKK
ncbi:uncharacterized protein LOC118646133 [Monomorium pharaonis]|uniref:uncharacterized protein LOC118646133 n=1 Tax=Monomorium pharaonis TaxID=307658 RepID=UPI001747CF3A|nr:uncharacterized protein LOC118646133 [Monomorium pharaonis]